MTDEMTASYARRVGERLRSVRKQQRVSLQAVEAASNEEFKASVLGAYERGERAISVPRLQRLAKFYHVPVDQLLPRDTGAEPDWSADRTDGAGAKDDGKVSIDLTRLDQTPLPEGEMLTRYLSMIQLQRQDFNGRILTIREDDLRAIAAVLDTRPDLLREQLSELGLRR